MLRGCEVAGCVKRKNQSKDPGLIEHGENWWRCYQVDLITMRSLQDWQTFRKKWFSWLDRETLERGLSWEDLNELHWRLRMWFHEGIQPPNVKNWVLRLIQPEIFAAINGVHKVSHLGTEQAWDDAVVALGTMGYLKLDEDDRLFIDTSMLGPDDNEGILDPTQGEAHYIQHYREVMSECAKELSYTPPDWENIAEGVRRKTHQRIRIYSH